MTTRTLVDPTVTDAAGFVDDARDDALAVSVVGDCTAVLGSRAERSLDAGTRQVLCKPDGTVLVHGATGRDPVVWSSGGDVTVDNDAGTLVLRREDGGTAADALMVRFESVASVTTFDPATAESNLSGPEGTLKEHVLSNPDLVEPEFRALATERDTPAGPVDIYGRGQDGAVVAVELTARRARPTAVSQLERYVYALRDELHADATVRGVVVAPDVTKTRELEVLAHLRREVVLAGGHLVGRPERRVHARHPRTGRC